MLHLYLASHASHHKIEQFRLEAMRERVAQSVRAEQDALLTLESICSLVRGRLADPWPFQRSGGQGQAFGHSLRNAPRTP